MAEQIDRLRYFTGQFLREKDFNDQQDYHIAMRWRHNRTLHTIGVVEGLDFLYERQKSVLTVRQGSAIDRQGREIVLAQDWSDDLTKYKQAVTATLLVTIKFFEVSAELSPDAPTDTKADMNTRFQPEPVLMVSAATAAADLDAVVLGRVTIDPDGRIQGSDDGEGETVRRWSGAVGRNLSVTSLDVTGAGPAANAAHLGMTSPGQLDLRGSLAVTGTITAGSGLGVATAAPAAPLDVGGNTARKLQAVLTRGTDPQFQLCATNGDDNNVGSVQATFGLKYGGDPANFDVATLKFIRGVGALDGALAIRTNGAERMRLDSAGDVGIGTAAPAARLEVVGTILSSAKPWAQDASEGVFLGLTGSVGTAAAPLSLPPTAQGLTVYNTTDAGFFGLVSRGKNNDDFNTVIAWGDNDDDDLEFRFKNANKMIVKPSGRVGIGTTTPIATLDVGGKDAKAAQAVLTRGADENFQLCATNGDDNNAGSVQATFGLRYGGDVANLDVATLKFIRGGAALDGALALRTNGTERMRLDSAGNVGIGTAAPAARLEVVGTILSSAKPWAQDASEGVFLGLTGSIGGAAAPLFLPPTAQGLTAYNTTDAGFFGLVSRGKNDNDFNTVIAWGDDDDDDLEFRFKNANKVIVKPSGRVGIGTVTPTSTLDVAGTINATSYTVNGVALGNSQWVAGAGGALSYAGGRVGVGTSAPLATLDVDGKNAKATQAVLTRGTDDNFQLCATNGDDNNAGSVQATFGLRYGDSAANLDVATLKFIRGLNALDGALAIRTNGAERMRLDSAGRVGIGIGGPNSKLDVASQDRTGSHPAGLGLYVTATCNPDSNGVEFRHSNGTQGIGFGYNTIYATGTNGDQDLTIRSRGNGVLKLVSAGNTITLNGANPPPFGGPVSDNTARATVRIDGDLFVTGRIGAAAGHADNEVRDPIPRHRGWHGGLHVYDLEVEASAWTRNAWQTGAADLAEIYFSDLDLSAGVLVSLDPTEDRIVPSREVEGEAVIGIVSSGPGVLLNSQIHAEPSVDGRKGYPIALSGRVPCKVTAENGPIRRGDRLTASSTPGYAMRAEPILLDGRPIYRPGTVVGKALESHAAGEGTIEVFVTLQ